MGAPKLNRVKLHQKTKNSGSSQNNTQDKLVIQQYAEKIHSLVKDTSQAKKLAQIISNYINSKK